MTIRTSTAPLAGLNAFRHRSGPAKLLALVLLLPAAACGPNGEEGGVEEVRAGAGITLEKQASYPEPFSYLSGVRPMPDGTLLAADPLGQVLLRLDMDAGVADTLGGVGEGPEEYGQPDRVYPLPGDSTLLVDLGNMRLTVLDPRGRFVETMPLTRPSENGRPTVLLPRFVDARGNIYFTNRAPGAEPPDSTYVVRFDRAVESMDTVARLWVPELEVERSGNRARIVSTMLEGQDDWAAAPDGDVAVIRANDYSVEWYRPDGTVIRGASTPFEPLSSTEADKEALLEEMGSQGLSMFMTRSSEGATSLRMSRGGRTGGTEPSVRDFEWAETFPPFRDGRAMMSPAGNLWVERMGHVPESVKYDVFDAEGVRIATVELPPGSRIIGFGEDGTGGGLAYVTRIDDVGLTWLERYRITR